MGDLMRDPAGTVHPRMPDCEAIGCVPDFDTPDIKVTHLEGTTCPLCGSPLFARPE